MFFRKRKQLKWFKAALRPYRKGKLQRPYEMLFRYYMEIDRNLPSRRGEGHFEYFSMLKFNDIFDDAIAHVRSFLPETLLTNFNAALAAYEGLGEEPEVEQIIAAFEEYDDYAAEHAEELAAILQRYIAEEKTKNAF